MRSWGRLSGRTVPTWTRTFFTGTKFPSGRSSALDRPGANTVAMLAEFGGDVLGRPEAELERLTPADLTPELVEDVFVELLSLARPRGEEFGDVCWVHGDGRRERAFFLGW